MPKRRIKQERKDFFPTTLQFKAVFEKREDFEKIKELTRRQSSAARAIYQRLKKGQSQKEIYNYIKETYRFSPWYISSAIQIGMALLKYKKVIFGGKNLFEKLEKKPARQKKGRSKKRVEGKKTRQVSKHWGEKSIRRLLKISHLSKIYTEA